MTDGLSVDTSAQSQVQESSAPIVEKSSVENTQTPSSVAPIVQTEKPAEKMLRQSEVNELVGSIRKEAYEKGKREAAQLVTQSQSSSQVNTNSNVSDDKVRTLIQEEARRMANEQLANRTFQEFVQKIETAKSKYPDIEQTIADLELGSSPQVAQIVSWANSLDNTAEVMYDIGKHPEKYASVLMLSHTNPRKAVALLQSLSGSIKKNEDALKQQLPNEPLSQVKPSTTGADNGSMTVSDYKKQSWLRG